MRLISFHQKHELLKRISCQNCRLSWPYTSSGILSAIKHSGSETGCVSILRRGEGDACCWVPYKKLIWITGPWTMSTNPVMPRSTPHFWNALDSAHFLFLLFICLFVNFRLFHMPEMAQWNRPPRNWTRELVRCLIRITLWPDVIRTHATEPHMQGLARFR
jgi:hypothetical protein